MHIVTPSEMAEIDTSTMSAHGLPQLVLMENAARSVLPYIPEGKTSLLIGPGNNGGDGLVIARALKEKGERAKAFLLSENLSEDGATQRRLAEEWGVETELISDEESLSNLQRELAQSSVAVDALFGTGLSRPLEGRFRKAVEMVNEANLQRIAVDIPSGIDGRNGQKLGEAIKAHTTVTFGCYKRGQLLHPGRAHCGTLELTQPGFHPKSLSRFDRIQLFTPEWARKLLPNNWETMHKGDNGRLLLLTGSEQYPGAGIISTLGALKGGAGLVTHCSPSTTHNALLQWAPEAMPLAREQRLPDLSPFNALVIGSGLGPDAPSLGRSALESGTQPTVVDADCLQFVKELTPERRKQCILTPHPGEMSRLTGRPVKELESDRITSALEAAKELGAVVLFKGNPTVTAAPNGRVFVNSTGNSILAQGGTGDLLAGLVGAYLAYGLPAEEAAACGAYIHGLAADLARKKIGSRGITATKICELVPIAYEKSVGNRSYFPVS